MSEILKKPYEISIWEDRLMHDGDETYYQEIKIAVIGADTMDAPNRVYSPVLTENVNGEVTLTFSLYYRYYDEMVGDFVVNPFASYLVNERKVKLKYNDRWYDLIIKECQENSEDMIFSYTATSAFVQELSRNGYNITFNTDLNNNQGTIIELAKKTLEQTDWEVDEADSDLLKQKITEPIVRCRINNNGFSAKNLDTNEIIDLPTDDIIYIFYSYLKNKTIDYVQFIREVDKPEQDEPYDSTKWSYDSNDAINGTNYRFTGKIFYEIDETTNFPIAIRFGVDNSNAPRALLEAEDSTQENPKIGIKAVDTRHQGYRLVYNQRTTYDPVAERTVKVYQAHYTYDTQDIYSYEDNNYGVSSLITSYVTNGRMNSVYSGDYINGWSNANATTGSSLPSMEISTDPPISINNSLINPNATGGLVSYLKVTLPAINNYNNTIYNSGILDSSGLINGIAKGEKYVFRFRIKNKNNASNFKALIARYNYEERTIGGEKYTVKVIDPKNIYFWFNGRPQDSCTAIAQSNNYITGGSIDSNNNYVINGVIQTPSRQYIYKVGNNNYYYNFTNNRYESIPNTYSPYYCYVAAALKPIPKSVLANASEPIGLFIYSSANVTYEIEEVQLFKHMLDKENNIVLPGSAPEAEVNSVTYYYLKPDENTSKDELNLYTSLESVADYLAISMDRIKPLQNEDCEKILSINEEKSNCFNILQSLCETFECWLKINVEHEENGAIKLNSKTHKPLKKVTFKEYVGKDNFAGFRYGINLQSIQRSIDSSEFVSKLIVNQPPSDYTDSGILSIGDAKANPSGESYILNFNYYINQKLIQNPEEFNADLHEFNLKLSQKNASLKAKNNDLINIKGAYEKAKSALTVYTSAYEAAQEQYAQALSHFESVSNGTPYSEFYKTAEASTILNDSTIASTIYDIYAASLEVNKYGGLLTNVRKEYNTLSLKYKGAQTYTFTVSTTYGGAAEGTRLTCNEEIEGFKCVFITDDLSVKTFWPDVNKKYERSFQENVIYAKLEIQEVPKDYELQYLENGSYVTISNVNAMKFSIYDTNHQAGIVRRFRLIPKGDYVRDNIGLVKEIENIQKEKDELEKAFFAKYSNLIQEGTWESTDYVDPELYYLDALQVSNTSAQPKVSYQISVAEISEIEDFENYIFNIGDKTYIEDTEFFGWEPYTDNDITVMTPIKEIVIVSEIEWHLDEPENNLVTVQNYKTQFEDLFQRISAAVQTVQYNQANYSRAASILDSNGRINAKLLVNSLNAISSDTYELASSGIVKATDEGLVVRDLTNSGNLIIIRSRGIERSEDGGQTWLNLISAKGVNTEALTAGQVDTQQIQILDGKNPTFRWDKSGISAYGFDENGGFDLKTFVRFDKYGIYGIQNNDSYIAPSLNDIKNKAQFGLTWDGFFIKNAYGNGYTSISSTDDIQVVANNIENEPIERIKIGAIEFEEGLPSKYGIKIRNDEGETVFETDDNGDITITGTINATAGEFSGLIRAAEGQIGGFDIGEYELYHGNFGDPGSIYLSTGHLSQRSIANFYGLNTWAITISDRFGVDTSGALYATAANISGTIHATNGEFTGHVNATSGNFTGDIMVGQSYNKYIKIEATERDAIIASSDYISNTSTGWMINSGGDAIFNNVSVRGAIKTAVFEYSEIEAVGGAFLFRPSSTIKTARIEGNDVILTTEKKFLFNQNEWVKVSNINDESGVNNILSDGGLTHVYRIKNDPVTDEFIILDGAASDFIEIEPWARTDVAMNINGTVEMIYTDPEDDTNRYVFVDDENNVSTEIDLVLQPGYKYYFNYDFRQYVKNSYEANWTDIIYPSETSENEDEIIEMPRSVIFVGNISIINPNGVNTGESFVIATEIIDEEPITKIYAKEGSTCFFKLHASQADRLSTNIADLEGGALISFGYYDIAYRPFNTRENDNPYQYHLYELINGEYILTSDTEAIEGKTYYKEQYENGANNYGIGINSSDNYVNLPERAISLFETKIKPNQSVKVEYDYKGILGTLPDLGNTIVNRNIYSRYMSGTQGIFTNNMYIGDNNQYIAFYTDGNGDKQLRIKAKRVLYEMTDDQGQGTGEYADVANLPELIDEQTPIRVEIESSAGNMFLYRTINTILTCTVYKGNENITSQVSSFTWQKKDKNGNIDENWHPPLGTRNELQITTNDVDSKAIFICTVQF